MHTSDKSLILAGIQWQESLLQAYRNYLLLTQSIFIAVFVILLFLQKESTNLLEKLLFCVPSIVIFVIGIFTLYCFYVAISERTKAVDWWQKRLLRRDNIEEGFKHFVTFRISKAHSFNEPTIEAHKLDESQIENLLRPGKPKARIVFKTLVLGFVVTWLTLLASSIFDFLI